MAPTRHYLTRDDLQKVLNIAEGLVNLNYLIGEEVERPDKVREYANLSETHLRTLVELLRSRRDSML